MTRLGDGDGRVAISGHNLLVRHHSSWSKHARQGPSFMSFYLPEADARSPWGETSENGPDGVWKAGKL